MEKLEGEGRKLDDGLRQRSARAILEVNRMGVRLNSVRLISKPSLRLTIQRFLIQAILYDCSDDRYDRTRPMSGPPDYLIWILQVHEI